MTAGSTPAFTLTLERHGGFAGIAMRATIDSADLAPAEARELWALVLADRLADAERGSARQASAGRRPDGFSYRLSVTADGNRAEYAFDEVHVGTDVRPLLDRLERDLSF